MTTIKKMHEIQTAGGQTPPKTSETTTQTTRAIFASFSPDNNICDIPESKQAMYTGREEDYFPDENDK